MRTSQALFLTLVSFSLGCEPVDVELPGSEHRDPPKDSGLPGDPTDPEPEPDMELQSGRYDITFADTDFDGECRELEGVTLDGLRVTGWLEVMDDDGMILDIEGLELRGYRESTSFSVSGENSFGDTEPREDYGETLCGDGASTDAPPPGVGCNSGETQRYEIDAEIMDERRFVGVMDFGIESARTDCVISAEIDGRWSGEHGDQDDDVEPDVAVGDAE